MQDHHYLCILHRLAETHRWTQHPSPDETTVTTTNKFKQCRQLDAIWYTEHSYTLNKCYNPTGFITQPHKIMMWRLLNHPVTDGSDHDPFSNVQNVDMWSRWNMQKYRAVLAIQSMFLCNRGVNTCGYLADVLANCFTFGGIWRRRFDFNSIKPFTASLILHYECSAHFVTLFEHLCQIRWVNHSYAQMLWEEIPWSVEENRLVCFHINDVQ